MDSSPQFRQFGKQCDALLADYLDGRAAFEPSLERLVALLRAQFSVPSTPAPVPEPGPKEDPVIIADEIHRLAVGRSQDELEKVSKLLSAAFSRLKPDRDGAA